MSSYAKAHQIYLNDFTQSNIAETFELSPNSIDDGQIIVKVDKIALTSNSISYVIGSQRGLMSWLEVFPAPDTLGHIPCWGFGDVLLSKNANVPEGERLYGFFPVASHVVLTPGKHGDRGFTDIEQCRAGVAPFYNEYSFVRREQGYAPEFENMMMLFRPLFGTSFLLESYCIDNDFFERAKQIIVTSASAKTSMGFGYLLKKNHSDKIKVIGLTSQRNKAFVEKISCYDDVITYEEIEAIPDDHNSILFDVAGNRDVVNKIHTRLKDKIIYSGQVGQTHWEDKDEDVPTNIKGPQPVYWSGPDQVMTLRERHGERGFMKLVQSSMVDFMIAAFSWFEIDESAGLADIDVKVKRMLNGKVDAERAIVLSP